MNYRPFLTFLIFFYFITASLIGFPVTNQQARVTALNYYNERLGLGSNKGGASQAYSVVVPKKDVVLANDETQLIIVPSDLLKISYLDKGERQEDNYRVSSTGFIRLPLVGLVHVAGQPKYSIQNKVTHEFQKFIRYPEVEISVNTSGRVMVIGEVSRPGIYDVQKGMSVFEAILKAGGYKQKSASLSSVMLTRGPANNPKVMRLNLKKMIKKGNRQDDIVVKPGDMVYIPASFVHNIDSFVDTVYRHVLTWYGLGGQEIIKEGEPFIGPIE